MFSEKCENYVTGARKYFYNVARTDCLGNFSCNIAFTTLSDKKYVTIKVRQILEQFLINT